jgi:hypothetical protein
MNTLDHETHHGPHSGVSHHLTPYSILCDTPRHPRLNVTFSRDSRVGVPKLSRNCPRWSPGTPRLESRNCPEIVPGGVPKLSRNCPGWSPEIVPKLSRVESRDPRDSRVGVPKLSRNCPGSSPRTLGAHNSRLQSLIATRSEPNL